ncbi:MAG: hypothetical protein KBD73_04080 [Candidatus Magasanikbacteria bacterium]|nr:hypothetical protein [Candidatus Magasanikbacteria bacterium]
MAIEPERKIARIIFEFEGGEADMVQGESANLYQKVVSSAVVIAAVHGVSSPEADKIEWTTEKAIDLYRRLANRPPLAPSDPQTPPEVTN